MNSSLSTQCGLKKEYGTIDILKFIGALFVIAIHTAPFNSINSLLNHGFNNFIARTAIPIYFASTGFFLFKKCVPNNLDFNIPLNYCKKILRLYAIWTLIYSPLIIRNVFLQKSILPFVKNLIFNGTYTHLWYLGATIVGVLLISLLIKFKFKVSTIIIIACALYICGLFLQTDLSAMFSLRSYSMSNLITTISNISFNGRNGIFFAFPLITLGFLFTLIKPKIKLIFSIHGILISLFFLFLEAFIVQYLHLAKDYNLYFFLIPLTFFIFSLALNIELKPKKIYKNLRVVGILTYFIHPIFIVVFGSVTHSLIKYFLVTAFSLAFAECVYYLKNFKYFNFLSKLYS